jgi:hypothetical protein
MTPSNTFHLNKCEWCGKNEIVYLKEYKEVSHFRFVEVFGREHCICCDCYERLE